MNAKLDSNYYLCHKAAERGIEVDYTTPEAMSQHNDGLQAAVINMLQLGQAIDARQNPLISLPQTQQIEGYDLVLMRQDPPFNMRYLTLTYWLEQVSVAVTNPPKAVRDFPEKLAPQMVFPHFCPPTLITHSQAEARAFWQLHGDVIVKPLYLFGSRDIMRVQQADDLSEAWNVVQSHEDCTPLVVQKTLPVEESGDVRVYFMHGKMVGCFKRIPVNGGMSSAVSAGANFVQHTLTSQEQMIADAVGPWLTAHNIALCGIDIIAGYLTEINITCPSGFQFIDALYGGNVLEHFFLAYSDMATN